MPTIDDNESSLNVFRKQAGFIIDLIFIVISVMLKNPSTVTISNYWVPF